MIEGILIILAVAIAGVVGVVCHQRVHRARMAAAAEYTMRMDPQR